MEKQIVIFSHGFGVRKDDRGLFTDIVASLPDVHAVLFDYNEVDEARGTLTVPPLDRQAEKLQQVVAKVTAENPGATVDLICHSQGCAVAALAQPPGVRKVIFAAPPDTVDLVDKIQRRQRKGSKIDLHGVSKLVRADGSITIIPAAYWASLKHLDAQALYNQLSEHTELAIISANNDEVLGKTIFGRLSDNITTYALTAGHNFEGRDRAGLITLIAWELQLHE